MAVFFSFCHSERKQSEVKNLLLHNWFPCSLETREVFRKRQ